MSFMNRINTNKAISLMKKYGADNNLINHCRQVSRIAFFLAKRMKNNGYDVNVNLVKYAGLLHDIGKGMAKRNKLGHGALGYEILVKEGYPEIAEVVLTHSIKSIKDEEMKTWEQKIVNYADRRVDECQIVPLVVRLKKLAKRHKRYAKEIMDTKVSYLKLEREIMKAAKTKPSLPEMN